MKLPFPLALALLLALAGSPTSSPGDKQEPAPPAAQATPSQTFPSAVELVTVDVAVVDRKGQAMPGFGKDDFVVTENGKPQTITSFEAVVVPGGAGGPPRATRLAPTSTQPGGRAPPRPDLRRRLRRHPPLAEPGPASPGRGGRVPRTGVAEGDRVVLVATGGGAWWNARMPEGREQLLAILKRLDGRYIPDSSPDRITEYEAMRIEEYQDEQMADRSSDDSTTTGRGLAEGPARREAGATPTPPPPASFPDVIRSRAQEVHNLATSRNKITLKVMTARRSRPSPTSRAASRWSSSPRASSTTSRSTR